MIKGSIPDRIEFVNPFYFRITLEWIEY